MPLKATSGGVSASVGVTSTKLRASISVEVLQASVSSAKATTSVTYELANATGIYVDPDSLNRMIKDEYALSDIRFNLVEKNLSETVTLDENVGWSYDKNAPETLALVESFIRAVSYNRTFTDAFTLDDLSQIDKDFYGNKGNVAFMTDIIGLDQTKVLTDSYTVGDVITLAVDYIREFTDSYSFADDTVYTFVKNVSDAFTLDDSALINKDFTGDKGNVFGFSDLLGNDFGKALTDNISQLDEVSILQDLNKSDSTTLSDTYETTLNKAISDAFTLDDALQVDKDYFGNKGNVLGFSDDVRDVHLSKTFADTFTVYDERPNALNVNMFNTQDLNSQDDAFLVDRGLGKSDALAFSEITAFNHDKGLGESLTFSDDYGLQLVKTLSDGFALDDSALVDKDYFGNKGNIVGVSDQVTVDYFYGGLVGQRPLNSIQLN